MKRILLAAAALLCVPAWGTAQIQLPDPVGYVNDFANVIPPEDEARIQTIVDEVRQKSGGEIVVVTLPSLEGRTRDEVALQIGREWRIGQEGAAGDRARNTGAVVLVVPRETSPNNRGDMKIELGDNTSTFITAAEAGRIRDDYMIPAFRAGDYGQGITAGVAAIAVEYAENFGFELTGESRPPPPQRGRDDGGNPFFTWIFIAFILLMVFGRRGRMGCLPIFIPMGGRGGGFGGGGFGGGGFGGGGFGGFGGGGGFSGGGAGGSW